MLPGFLEGFYLGFGQVLIARKTIFNFQIFLMKVLWKQCGLLLEDLWKRIIRILGMFLM
jgi:hypothetical protein